jgi:catechol 2,3-dioxygenase
VKLRWRGALFVAAGDYHHHLGLNVWHSYQGGSVDPRSRGLRGFTLFLPRREWKSAVERLSSAAGVRLEGETAVLTDPFGIQVRLKPVRD